MEGGNGFADSLDRSDALEQKTPTPPCRLHMMMVSAKKSIVLRGVHVRAACHGSELGES